MNHLEKGVDVSVIDQLVRLDRIPQSERVLFLTALPQLGQDFRNQACVSQERSMFAQTPVHGVRHSHRRNKSVTLGGRPRLKGGAKFQELVEKHGGVTAAFQAIVRRTMLQGAAATIIGLLGTASSYGVAAAESIEDGKGKTSFFRESSFLARSNASGY